ncbi:MAG: hypothetical protein CVU65_13950 [Deltaproteobacteria bacterium HGW-Deltaproteobacteria-22]|nr:MAG: hypothetical protein CVU65_13950 [Deltaproteobacteria bacterium HGW-Deltaproteobacteria-22]
MGRYLVLASPLVLAVVVWGAIAAGVEGGPPPRFASGAVQWAWDLLGIHLLAWLALLLYFFVVLVVSSALRDAVLTRLAGIRERDEREELIVGQAARASWLSTLALLVFLLLLSGLQVQVRELPAHLQKPGARGSVSIGYVIQLQPVSSDRQPAVVNRTETGPSVLEPGDVRFSFSGVPLSSSALLLILLCWHVLSFHLFSRRVSGRC